MRVSKEVEIKYKKEAIPRLLNMPCGEGGELPMLSFPALSKISGIRHGFTTRLGGVSEGIFSSLNLAFSRGDEPERVMENYRRVAAAFGVSVDDIVTAQQTHTTNVVKVGREHGGEGVTRERSLLDVDGMVTDERGLLLSTFHADCAPIYFVDPVHRAIGLAHSGWRGTVGRIASVVLHQMNAYFGTNTSEVYAAVGPAICSDCYEVGEDVAEEVRAAFPDAGQVILRERGNGKYDFNLWKANEMILRGEGVLVEHISIASICTCENPDLIFSHRATKGRRGNSGAFLMME